MNISTPGSNGVDDSSFKYLYLHNTDANYTKNNRNYLFESRACCFIWDTFQLGATYMIHETSKLHLLEQRTRMLDTLSTIVEMLLQLPAPQAYVDAAGSSSAMLQQVAQHIVDLMRQHLDCAHVSLLVSDHNTRIFYPAALSGFSAEQARRFRANIAGFRLSD